MNCKDSNHVSLGELGIKHGSITFCRPINPLYTEHDLASSL